MSHSVWQAGFNASAGPPILFFNKTHRTTESERRKEREGREQEGVSDQKESGRESERMRESKREVERQREDGVIQWERGKREGRYKDC